MLVASILPVANLERTIGNPYHMALAQFIGVDEDYTKFFQDTVKSGAFVIMDNGAAEGEQPTIEQLIPKIELLRPSEIVLPDTIYDKDVTLTKGANAIFELAQFMDETGIEFQIMAVPQGKTFEEWVECMREMLTWPIDTLGISKFVTPKYGDHARFKCVGEIEKAWLETGHRKQIHLLGCWNHPMEIGQIDRVFNSLKQEGLVRGTDSAIPYVYATMGKKIDEIFERPEYHMDFRSRVKLTDELEELLTHNIKKWEGYCNAKL